MKHFLDAFKAFGAVFSSFVRPPTTVQFPKEVRPRAERYRASFALLHEENGDEACIGCLQCERICPSKVISIKGPAKRDSPITGKKRSYADDFTLDLSACIFCELCVQVCPTDAIVMTREQEVPTYSREELVLTMPKLYANEKSKTRAWGDATKLNAMQAIPKPATAPAAPSEKPAAPAAAVTAAAAPGDKPAPPATAAAAPGEKTTAPPTTAAAAPGEKPAPPATAAAAPGEKPAAPAAAAVTAPAPGEKPVTPSGVEAPKPSGAEGSATATQALSPAGERETIAPPAVAVPETKS